MGREKPTAQKAALSGRVCRSRWGLKAPSISLYGARTCGPALTFGYCPQNEIEVPRVLLYPRLAVRHPRQFLIASACQIERRFHSPTTFGIQRTRAIFRKRDNVTHECFHAVNLRWVDSGDRVVVTVARRPADSPLGSFIHRHPANELKTAGAKKPRFRVGVPLAMGLQAPFDFHYIRRGDAEPTNPARLARRSSGFSLKSSAPARRIWP